jgi:hypothetical protein
MTAPSSQTQKPGDPSPYASLRPSLAADGVQRPPSSPPGFTAELAKLQELRDALWEAFKAGPDAGLPTILIELTNSYTNSLRIQLNMKSLNSRQPKTSSLAPNQLNAGARK